MRGTVAWLALWLCVAPVCWAQDAGEARARDWHQPATPEQAAERVAALEPLPADASSEQVLRFATEVARASQGQNRRSSRDRQVTLLKQIDDEHLDVLLRDFHEVEFGIMRHGPSPNRVMRYYQRVVLAERLKPMHQPALLAALPQFPWLIDLVDARGWERAAREVILAGVADGEENPAWLRTAATLEEPAAHAALTDRLLKTNLPQQVYPLLADLPGYDLGAVADEWWAAASDPTRAGWQQYHVATLLVRHGHRAAMDLLVDALNDPHLTRTVGSLPGRTVREHALRHLAFQGTNAQITRWYILHRDRLTFNRETLKFELPGPMDPAWLRHAGLVREPAQPPPPIVIEDEALASIRLPADPAPEQARAYVRAVGEVMEKHDAPGRLSDQVRWLLWQVPDAHLPALMDPYDVEPGARHPEGGLGVMRRMCAALLHERMTEAHAPALGAALQRHPWLLDVVRHGDWTHHVRKQLLTLKGPGALPSEAWMWAVASLEDDEARQWLRDVFLTHHAPERVYLVMMDTPGMDLDGAVAALWAQAGDMRPMQRMEAATLAVRHGHADALALLIDRLTAERSMSGQYLYGRTLRQVLLRHVAMHGSNDELVQWHREHRETLRFDRSSRKFTDRVGETSFDASSLRATG